MKVMHTLTVKTVEPKQVVDITTQVRELVKLKAGLVNVFVTHTTCAISTADLDPGTDQDYLNAAWEMIPKLKYAHPHNPEHVPAHILATFIGPGVTVPIEQGDLKLGTWQRIVLLEFDGPRERQVTVTFAPAG